MGILLKYVWIIGLVFVVINAFSIKHKSKKYIAENPDLERGYTNYFIGFLLLGSMLWILMGIGILSGSISNIFEFFNPRSSKTIIQVFFSYIILMWCLGVWWIYFKGGAEFIEKHPGLVQYSSFLSEKVSPTARQVKLFFPLLILGGVIGIIMMWKMDVSSFLTKFP